MKKMMQEAQNRFLALRGRFGSSASRGEGSRRVPRKLIVVTSMVLLVAIFSSVLMLGVVPGGEIEAMAGSGSLTSVSGEKTIPGQYSPVNVPAGTHIITKENYKNGTVTQSSDGLAVFDFHIFAEKFASTAHTCGNIAVKVLGQSVLGTSGAPEFGSRSEHDTDSIKLSYVGELHGWSAATKVENQVFGSKVQITGYNGQEAKENGQVFVVDSKGTSHMMGNDNNGNMLNNIYIDTGAPEYINIKEELKEAESYMRWLVWLMKQTDSYDKTSNNKAEVVDGQKVIHLTSEDISGGMGFGFFGWGGTTIDLSGYDADTIIIDLSAEPNMMMFGQSDATRLISGMVKLTGTTGKRVVFNIDASKAGPELKFSDTTMTADKLSNTEDSANKDNNIIWNFYELDKDNVPVSYKGKITVGGTWIGTINAPEAKVFCRAGLNGSIIAKEVATTAETHKSDYTGERVAKSTINLTVTKIWEDDPSMRPEFITLQLLRDGKVISTVQVSQNNSDSDIPDTTYNWYYTFKDLPATDEGGNTYQYKVQELAVPGYETSQVNNTIVNTSTNEDVVIPVTYQLTVRKTDGSAPLSGAVLRLTGDNLSAATFHDENGNKLDTGFNKTDKEITWTSNGSAVIIKNLSAGNYTVSEVSAPAGYKLAADQSFHLNSDKIIDVVNTPIEVTFNKLNGQNTDYKAFLSGAKFELTPNWGNSLAGVNVIGATVDSANSGANKITFTTGTSAITFKGIAAGSYTLTETEAPEGYQTAAPITFIIDANGNVTINGNFANSVDVYNYLKPAEPKYYSLNVSKVDGSKVDELGNYVSLPNAQFTLSAIDKNTDFTKVKVNGGTTGVDTTNKTVAWTSGTGAAQITGLPEGSYTLTETKVPDGYKKAADVSIVLNDNTTTAGVASVEVKNEPIKLNVAKVDSISGAYVAGATLTLTGPDYSNTIITKGALVELSGLKPGIYTLTESDAPDGYTQSNVSQVFEIKENGSVVNKNNANISGITVTMKNEPTQVSIIKQYWRDLDNDGNAESGETGFLAGAKLTLSGSVDLSNVTGTTTVEHIVDPETGIKSIISWTSGSSANVLRGLPEGTYTLTEDKAPDGYEMANPITFTVGANGKVNGNADSVTLVNKKVTYHTLQVHKVDKDNTNKYLAGATLAIFKKGTTDFDPKNAVVVFQSTGDKNNPNEFKLPTGEYILVELAAPEGYNLSTEKVEFKLDSNGNVTGGTTTTPTSSSTESSSATSATSGSNNGNAAITSGEFSFTVPTGLSVPSNYGAAHAFIDITSLSRDNGMLPTKIEMQLNNSSGDGSVTFIENINVRVYCQTESGYTCINPNTAQNDTDGVGDGTLSRTINSVNGYSVDENTNYVLGLHMSAQIRNNKTVDETFLKNAGFNTKSVKLYFGDTCVTINPPSTASAYEIASGESAASSVETDNFTYGLPSGMKAGDAFYDNINGIAFYAYVDITEKLSSYNNLPSSLSLAVNINSDAKLQITTLQANLVKFDGSNTIKLTNGAANYNVTEAQKSQGAYTSQFDFNISHMASYEAGAKYYIILNAVANEVPYKLIVDGDVNVFNSCGIKNGTMTVTQGAGSTTQPAVNGTINLLVVDKDNTNVPLSGVQFKLVKDNNEVTVNSQNRWTTGSDGKITVSGLEAGTYQFVQTNSISGYGTATGDPATITSSSTSHDLTYKAQKTANSTITLTLKDNFGNTLDGVTFKLKKDGADYQSNLTTSNGGQIQVTGLAAGNYSFEQTSGANAGYNKAEEVYQYVDGQQTYTVSATANRQTGQITLTLNDKDTNAAINGAKFELQRSTDGSTFSKYSDVEISNNGTVTVTGLDWGYTYRVVQTSTPSGYDINSAAYSPATVTIAANDLNKSIAVTNEASKIVDIEGGNGEPIVITFANTQIAEESRYLYGLKLKKTDGNNAALSGAVFNLFNANGKLIKVNGSNGTYTEYAKDSEGKYVATGTVTNLVTGDDGYIYVNGLEVGDYYLYETKAPDGYILSEERVDITVTDANTGDNYAIYAEKDNNGNLVEKFVVNELQKASLMITKQDTNGRPLSGMEFELHSVALDYSDHKKLGHYTENNVVKYGWGTVDSEGKVSGDSKLSYTFTTENDGNYTFTGLEPNRIYYVVETKAPAGMNTVNGTKYPVLTEDVIYKEGYNYGIALGTIKVPGGSENQTITCYDGIISITNTPVKTVIEKTDDTNLLAGAVLKLEPVRTEGAANVSSTTALKDPTLSNVTIMASYSDVSDSDVSFSDVIEFTYTEVNGEQVVSGINYEYLTWTTTDKETILYGLPSGEYILSELEAPAGYAVADPMEIYVEADGKITYNGNTAKSLEMVDTILTGQITLTKSDAVNGDRIVGAQFELHRKPINDSEAGFTRYGSDVYTTDDKGVVTASGLDWGYEYKFVELTPAGYAYDASSAVYSPASVEITADSLSAEITATNERLANGQLTLVKTDVDNNTIKISGAKFDLYRRIAGTGLEFQKWNTEALVTDANGTISVTGLDWGYEYYFEEIEAAPNYDNDSAIFTDAQGNRIFVMDGNGNVTNPVVLTAASNSATVNVTNKKLAAITVTKIWDDNNNQDTNRPDVITVNLMNGTTVVSSADLTAADLSAENTWTHTWTGLDSVDATGAVINYTVDEEAVQNYNKHIDGYVITNSYGKAYDTTKITLTKIWDDADNQDGCRPTQIIVDVLNGDEVVRDDLVLTEADVVSKSDDGNEWTWEITGLTKNAGGSPITYTVEEVRVENGYEASAVTGTMADGYVITNSYTPATTEIAITKIWNDSSNQDGLRPAAGITVTLTGTVEGVEDAVYTETKTITGGMTDAQWTDKFENLPKKHDGKFITYTVTEATVAGYNAPVYSVNSYTASDESTGGAFTITNTHVVGKINVTVVKQWIDADNQDGLRPQSVKVNLKANDVVISSADIGADSWTYTWENLDVNAGGTAIVYTVEEDSVPAGYTSVVDNYTIKNTHVPATTNLTVTKDWQDCDDQDDIRPDTITVKLLKNGEEVANKSVTLSEANSWTYTWEDLPVYDGTTTPVVYTVEETAVSGYNVAYEPATGYTAVKDGTGNIKITNTHTPDTVEVEVTKVWNNGSFTGSTPVSVTVQLLCNNDEVEGKTLVLNAQNNWSGKWSDLAKFSGNAESPNNYSVKELTVPGYESVVSGTANKFTITNTRIAEGQITLIKTDAANSAVPVVGAKFELLYRPAGSGDEFTSYKVGDVNWTGTTDNTGKIVVSDLYWGYEYKFVETEAAPGYKATLGYVDGETVTLGAADMGQNVDFRVTNERITTDAVFTKTDAVTSMPLEGATIKITNNDGTSLAGVTGVTDLDTENANIISWVSGKTSVVLSGLPAGNYTMEEITAPYGYEIAEKVDFVIDVNGAVKVYKDGQWVSAAENKVYMADQPVTAEISKLSAATTAELPGATLTLTLLSADKTDETLEKVYGSIAVERAGDNMSVAWLSGNEANTLYALPDGEYKLEEKSAPAGYEIAEAITFRIKDGKVEGGKIEMLDAYTTGEAIISKQILNAGDELPGATLTVTLLTPDVNGVTLEKVTGSITVERADDNMSVTWTSGDDANTLSALPDGLYKLTEVTAPDGYEKAEEIYFRMEDGIVKNTTNYDGANTVWTVVEDKTILMEDAPVQATISKQEVGGGDEIPGAELTVTLVTPLGNKSTLDNVTGSIDVTLSTDKKSVTWVSEDEANVLSALPDGIYTLTEVTEPDGYKVAEQMYFKVENGVVYNTDEFDDEDTDWDEADDATVIMEDAPVTATISKQEVGGGPEIPGAELTVTLVTPENEDATLEKVTGTIDVEYDDDTNSVTWVSEDEANVLSRLPDGIYTLTEVTAPAGYKVAEVMYFKVEDGVVYNTEEFDDEDTEWEEADDEKVIMEDAPVTANISKQAVGGGAELAGAKLTVKLIEAAVKGSTLENTTGSIKVDYDKKTNSVSWTSGDKANTLSVLPDGIYSLTETQAPTGYEIAETMYFKIDKGVVYNTTDYKEDGNTEWKKVDNSTIIMYDALTPADGTASFVKKSDLGNSLAGAVFTLKDSSGKTKTATSNANGIVSFTGLDAGEYELTETTAPTGYTKSSQKVIVKVADDGTVSWFTTNGDGIPVASVEVLFTNTYIIKPGTTPEKPVVGGKIDLSDNLDTALKDLDVEWSSSDNSIAEVDKNGVVTVKKPGNFTITATVNGKPVQNFVLGATDTTNSGTNGTTGNAPHTGNDLVQFGVTASAVLLGGFALMSAVVYGYKRKKVGSAKK